MASLVGAGVVGATPASVPRPVTGVAVEAMRPFDDLFERFMSEHDVPGAAVCVARGGDIVYSRGFGFADLDARTPVAPDALFRIASISKPITAVAVLRLVERGTLTLDDNPFVAIGLAADLDAPGADPRLRNITIRHLLHHAAGWDREATFDPMFAYDRIATTMGVPSPPDQVSIIRFMLRQPLDFDPGSRYAYSNFGYCVLGRVIEHATGRPYEQAVRELVLEPLGIDDMRIGRSLPADRAEREVRYHDVRARSGAAVCAPDLIVPQPYRIHHEVMDAHGAWIAGAPDLVRFATAFDDVDHSPLLGASMIELMFAPPPGAPGHEPDGRVKDVYYGMGWSVRRVGTGRNTWHTGYINGTSTLLVRRHDGLTWAVLFNGSDSASNGRALAGLIDGPMHVAADAVTDWPKGGASD
ncbi:MAG: beta-lactamase family protein [Phycisphaerales bacterium]|nr:beta-lactamase family protein [Phycisphaerales bacterium]